MTIAIKLSAEELEGTEASLSCWLVAVGDYVTEGQPILELETDKVSMELSAPASGIIKELNAAVGAEVSPDMILGYITKQKPGEATKQDGLDENKESIETVDSGINKPQSNKGRDKISPAVRRLVTEHGLDINRINGTGRDGRVTRHDVQNYLNSHKEVAAATPPADYRKISDIPSRMIPHTRMRKTIARHMVTSLLHTAPHVTSVFEMDLSNIMEHRKWHKKACERLGHSLTFTAYFAYAAALASKQIPEVNARFHEDYLEIFEQVNIGVGTALGKQGLVVPVIHGVESMELYQIAAALSAQTNKAREGHLTPEDMKGGTLTISNHGVSGSLFATPIIINQPEVAILGIGKLEKRAVVREVQGKDEIQISPMCYVSLTIDHRALDAHQTNQYLSRFVEIIEQWQG